MMHGEFQVGSALGRGFGIWLKNLPAFLLMSLIVYTPIIIYTTVVLSGDLTLESLTRMELTSALLSMGLNFLITAAVLYGVIQQLRGGHAGIGECMGVGLKRLFPVLGVAFVGFLLPALALGLVAYAVPIILLLAIVPAIIYFLMMYVAIPAAVVERPGVIGALKRSQELTSGYKLQIFGVLLILGVTAFAVAFLLRKGLVENAEVLSDLKTFYWADLIFDIAYASLGASINAVIYHDLRVTKEGVETEDLARVFE
jgi:hypothetical protein